MVKIKTATSLYHTQLGNINVGGIVTVTEEIADMLVKNGMAVIVEEVEKVAEPTKKKATKKGE